MCSANRLGAFILSMIDRDGPAVVSERLVVIGEQEANTSSSLALLLAMFAESLPYTSHSCYTHIMRHVQTTLRPIIPELFPILVRPYYSQNYSGIIRQSLIKTQVHFSTEIQVNPKFRHN